MNIGKMHQYIGLTLCLPLLAWAITGAVFITKPGNSGAYDQLSVKTYSQDLFVGKQVLQIDDWQEARFVRTILGLHFLKKKGDVWQHINGLNGQPWPQPSQQDMILLLEDAISINPNRYGDSVTYQQSQVSQQNTQEDTFISSTGITLSLDWNTLNIRQTGKDTELINALYKVHYLQWSGNKTIDKYFAVIGLIFLILLTVLGFKLFLSKR